MAPSCSQTSSYAGLRPEITSLLPYLKVIFCFTLYPSADMTVKQPVLLNFLVVVQVQKPKRLL